MKPLITPISRVSKASIIAGLLLGSSLISQSTVGQIFVSVDNGFAGNGQIGEYNADGTAVNASLVPEGSANLPGAMAVSGSYLYVANWLHSGSGYIAQYSTSGTLLNNSFITGLSSPYGLTTSAGNIYVANNETGTIAEYSSSGAVINSSLITGLNGPTAIAISGGNLFVVNNGNGTIGKYTTSGTLVNSSLITGLTGANGMAISGGHIFVNNANGIGE